MKTQENEFVIGQVNANCLPANIELFIKNIQVFALSNNKVSRCNSNPIRIIQDDEEISRHEKENSTSYKVEVA